MKKLAIVSLIFLALGGVTASQASGFNNNHFLSIHEVNPVYTPTQDVYGQPVFTVDQVDVLIQLPGQMYAHRVRANLKGTLFLDPRAPLPGQRKYNAVLGIDGEIEQQ